METWKNFFNRKLYLNSYNHFNFMRKAMKILISNTEDVYKMMP